MLDTPSTKKPNPIDVQVGARIRLRRTMMGMSQERLAEGLGITFQQVQKYEKGTNRVGASRLQAISTILKMPVAYFFEDAPPAAPVELTEEDHLLAFLGSAEGVALNRAFAKIDNPKIRAAVLNVVRCIAGGGQD